MIRKIVHDMQGSALAMVIILITILSTLGLAVMTLGFAHYKVGMVDKKAKLSFYMAESGLEQAYKIMLEEVAEAMKAGNEQVNMIVEATLQEEARRKDENETCSTAYVKDYYHDGTKYVIADAEWDQIQADIENNNWKTDLVGYGSLKDEFEQAYKNHFNTKSNNKYKLIVRLTDPTEYGDPADFNVGVDKPKIEVLSPPNPIFPASSDKTSLTLRSTYGVSEEGKIPQKVQMTFTLKIPEDEDILKNNYYYVYQEVIETNRASDLWHNALVAYGDVRVNAANVNIKGKVYAQGATDEGGFILTGMGRNVVANGVLATPTNVQIAEGAAGCALNINGNVYADNVLIRPNSDNNEINISGNVYTKDDLELNGSKARIEINGNYYGFSDGSHSDKHDESSGIVINAVDINQPGGSELRILGNEVFVNGVSYINVVDSTGQPYPTGESVSIKGNYRAYSYYLPGDDKYEEYEYGYYAPLTLVERQKNKAEGKWEDMYPMEKSLYFEKVSGEPDTPSWLNKGANIAIPAMDDLNKFYTLGAYISQGQVYARDSKWYGHSGVQTEAGKYSAEYLNNLLKAFSDYVEINNAKDQSSASEVIFFSPNQSIYLVGPGGNESVPTGSAKKIMDSNIKGIIVTNKDVHLRGEINFSGVIIAGGNIHIEDSYLKKIAADWYYVFEKINKEVKDEEDPFKYSDKYVNKVIESSLEITEPTSAIPYKKYITIDHWKKI